MRQTVGQGDLVDGLTSGGVGANPFFVGAPRGNGCGTGFTCTLKDSLFSVQTVDTAAEFRPVALELRQSVPPSSMRSRRWARIRPGALPNSIRIKGRVLLFYYYLDGNFMCCVNGTRIILETQCCSLTM